MGWISWGSLGLKLGSPLRFEKKMEKKYSKTSWWFQNHPSEKYNYSLNGSLFPQVGRCENKKKSLQPTRRKHSLFESLKLKQKIVGLLVLSSHFLPWNIPSSRFWKNLRLQPKQNSNHILRLKQTFCSSDSFCVILGVCLIVHKLSYICLWQFNPKSSRQLEICLSFPDLAWCLRWPRVCPFASKSPTEAMKIHVWNGLGDPNSGVRPLTINNCLTPKLWTTRF